MKSSIVAGHDRVILLHGLWLHALAMWPLRRGLERRGYQAHSYSYPTVRRTLSDNAERLGRYCEELGATKLHFVGHSLGGLLALKAAALVPPACRGRIVLLGTPYTDSFSARRLQRWPGGCALLGRCVGQWLTDRTAFATDGFEIGVIAGTGGIGMGRLVARGLPAPHDGVVSVEETHVPGVRDTLVLPVSHSQMLISREVARQACAFLDRGSFDVGSRRKLSY